ncbi:MAG: T9SS type A sorting domain-containing protein [Syntrophothermus sp.]
MSHTCRIFCDMLGREVSTLVSREQSAGRYNVEFDASSLPSGVYIYTLQTGSFRKSKKLLLLK